MISPLALYHIARASGVLPSPDGGVLVKAYGGLALYTVVALLGSYLLYGTDALLVRNNWLGLWRYLGALDD